MVSVHILSLKIRSEIAQAVLYEYQRTWGGEQPQNFLIGFTGDGIDGYHKVAKVTLVGCWAQELCKFDEALKAAPPGRNWPFATSCTRSSGSLRRPCWTDRQKQSVPVMEAYAAWLKKQRSSVLPKSLVGKAIEYILNQWEKLTAFLKDGQMELDNNRRERSIKPFVIGRKNWLIANTPRRAKASALLRRVTCQNNVALSNWNRVPLER